MTGTACVGGATALWAQDPGVSQTLRGRTVARTGQAIVGGPCLLGFSEGPFPDSQLLQTLGSPLC